MAFNGNFTVSQGTDTSGFTLTDTSTGSDINLTGRTVSLIKTDGTLLGGATINWPIGQSSITVTNVLDKDYSLSILVVWTSSSPLPSPSTYTKTIINTFLGYINNFIYGLIQQLTAQPDIKIDRFFYANLSKIQTEADNANQATTFNDQFSAQGAVLRAQYLITNKAYNF
jgi:hypothetical protein